MCLKVSVVACASPKSPLVSSLGPCALKTHAEKDDINGFVCNSCEHVDTLIMV